MLSPLDQESGLGRSVGDLLQKILGDEESVSCRQIEQKDLPQYITCSFQALARKQVKNSAIISIRQEREINVPPTDFKKAHEQFISIMQKSVIFSRSLVESCLKNALKMRYELLLHPRQASETIFFKKHEKLDKNVLLFSLDNFGKNIPFLEKLSERIAELPDDYITHQMFSELADQTLKDVYSNGHQKNIIKDSLQLVDFINICGENGFYPIEDEAVEEFFGSRGFVEIAGSVKEKKSNGRHGWTTEEFLGLIKSRGLDTTVSFGNNGNGQVHPRIIYADDLDEKIHKEKIERQPPGPYPSLLSFIKQDDWKFLLKKIFKKNSLEFAKFIYKIDKLEKWRDAKAVIDWELEQRKVDMYAKEAVRLSDLVFAKFFQKGEYS